MALPKSITSALPFSQKQKVEVLNDPLGPDKRRQKNLLEALNLPTKRPFKKEFMSQSEK
jgi:hypothetical protein